MILQGETGRNKEEEEKKKLSKSVVGTGFSTRSIEPLFQDFTHASRQQNRTRGWSTRWFLLTHGLIASMGFIEAQNMSTTGCFERCLKCV